jgi:hypothetical protein
MSGRTDQDGQAPHWVDSAPPPVMSRPPAPPAPVPSSLTAEQAARAEALRAATAGGPRDPNNAIRDAKIYAEWILKGV